MCNLACGCGFLVAFVYYVCVYVGQSFRAIYPASTGKLWCSHNTANMHYSGDREAMTYDGNGGPAYFGPVASSAAGSDQVTLPIGRKGGGGAAYRTQLHHHPV